jgi:hypothetical protein
MAGASGLWSTFCSSARLSISSGACSASNAGTPTSSNARVPAEPRSALPAFTSRRLARPPANGAQLGVGVAVVGLLIVVGYTVARALLPDDAARGVWDAYLSDLRAFNQRRCCGSRA